VTAIEDPYKVVRHNHLTRDIKPKGTCPACDRYHAWHEDNGSDDNGESGG
jgi:hypothetical protein